MSFLNDLHSDNDSVKHIKRLARDGLNSQAYQALEQLAGPITTWQDSYYCSLGIRILNELGFHRRASALALSMWRRQPDTFDAQYQYLKYLMNYKGPLRCLDEMRVVEKRFKPENESEGSHSSIATSLSAEEHSRWHSLFGHVYMAFRDWESAEQHIQLSERALPECDWLYFDYAQLDEAKDQYSQALERVMQKHAEAPCRASTQYAAHLKVLVDDEDGAIDLLEEHLDRFETLLLPLQLFRLHERRKNITDAKRCLERVEAHIPEEYRALGTELAMARFDLAYAQQPGPDAAQHLKGIHNASIKHLMQSVCEAPPCSQRKVLEVPFVRQHHMTCAPATMTAISKYWGKEAAHLDIVEKVCYDGTSNHAERNWAVEHDWQVHEFELTEAVGKQLIDLGLPFSMTTVAPGASHLQAVVGYDEFKQAFVIRDPYYPSLQEMLITPLLEQQAPYGPRCLLMVPKEYAGKKLEGIDLPASRLFDHYHALIEALDEHHLDKAQDAYAKMKAIDEGHRLSLIAKRQISVYSRDLLSDLDALDQLIARYPDDINALIEKSNTLHQLGRARKSLEHLDAVTPKLYPHPHLAQALANNLRQDHQHHERCIELYRYVLTRQPTNASALWGLAHTLWDHQSFERAYEYFRLSACLEDKIEGYVSSYFNAARHLKKTDAALERLKQRVQDLGAHSHQPYETLYHAYNTLNRDHEAIVTIEAALKAHPQEESVITRAIRANLYNARYDRAKALLEKHTSQLSDITQIALRMEFSEFDNDINAQMFYSAEALALNPLDYDLIDRNALLLGNYRGTNAAIKLIDEKLEANPDDLRLLLLKLDWSFEKPITERINIAKDGLKHFPRNLDLHLKLAQLYLSHRYLDEARDMANMAYEINPFSAGTLMLLGRVHGMRGDFTQAKGYFRQVITRDIDHENVFAQTLLCCPSIDEKREELQWIRQQILSSNTFGQAINAYANVARDYISDEELLSVLEAALQQRPDILECWSAMTAHLVNMNHLDQALDTVNRGIALFPLTPKFYLERCQVYLAKQEVKKALEDAESTYSMNARWVPAITKYADLLEISGDLPQAMSVIEQAITLNPNNATLRAYAADFLMQMGQTEDAREQLSKAIDVDPSHDWSWSRYIQLSAESGQRSDAIQKAEQLSEQRPYNPTLWRHLSELEQDLNKRLDILEKALAFLPRNESLNLTKARTLWSLNRMDLIDDVINDPKWNGDPPCELLAYEAAIEAQLQRYPQAIAKMQAIVESHPYYYEGWSHLAEWSERVGDRRRAIEYVDQCVRLYPHVTQTLTMAAELYLRAFEEKEDVSQNKIEELLSKAVALNPKNQHTVLTWLNYLLNHNPSYLAKATQHLQLDESKPHVLQHAIRIHLHYQEIEQARGKLRTLLLNDVDDAWLFHNVFEAFHKADRLTDFIEVFSGVAKNPGLNQHAGAVWMRHSCYFMSQAHESHENMNSVTLRQDSIDWSSAQVALDILDVGSSAWSEAVQYLLYYQYELQWMPKLIEHASPALQAEPKTWGAVVFYYVRMDRAADAARWGEAHWQRAANGAGAIYHYGFALRQLGRWSEASAVNRFALELNEDSYTDAIYLWSLVDDCILDTQAINSNTLNRIRMTELYAAEQFVLRMLTVMFNVQQAGGIMSASQQTFDEIHEAKAQSHDLLNTHIISSTKLAFKRRLKKDIQGGVLQRWQMMFRLWSAL